MMDAGLVIHEGEQGVQILIVAAAVATAADVVAGQSADASADRCSSDASGGNRVFSWLRANRTRRHITMG